MPLFQGRESLVIPLWWLRTQTRGPGKCGNLPLASGTIRTTLLRASDFVCVTGTKDSFQGPWECTRVIVCGSEWLFKDGGYGSRKGRAYCFFSWIYPGDKGNREEERNQDRRMDFGCNGSGWLAQQFYFAIQFILLVTFDSPLFIGHNSFSVDKVYFQEHLLGCYPPRRGWAGYQWHWISIGFWIGKQRLRRHRFLARVT